jgi:hypothetical protein
MGRAFYVESVEDAAALAGGHDRLAEALGVTPAEVRDWCAGACIPDCEIFLRVVELVTGASDPKGRSTTAAPAAESRAAAGATPLAVEA